MEINDLNYQLMMKDIKRCYGCQAQPCGNACPLNMPIPTILYSLKREDVDRVCELVYKNNPLPEMTTRLCDTDSQCKGNCVQASRGGGIDFRSVERLAYSNSVKKGDFCGDINKKVTIIGAGPAGLSAAKLLLKNGIKVKVIDKEDCIGGAVYTGVPDYRFPKSSLLKIKKDLEDLGCEFEFNNNVDSYDELLEIVAVSDFVLIAIGAMKERLLFEDVPQTIGGLSFLREYNINNTLGDFENGNEIFVMGGGNVAFDCARVLKRHVPHVSLIYRRSLEEMPASKDEIKKAAEEGVNIRFLENIVAVKQSENRKLCVTTVRNKLGEFDSSGRRKPILIEDSEADFFIDGVVLAIGESPSFACFNNKLEVNNDGSTNLEKVRAMGDCLYGARTVAKAIGNGRDEALKIINKLKGE